MTGVIAVMKPSLESQRMYSSRVLLGSVAASAAMCCVLSLSSAAVRPGDGFIYMPQPPVHCCYTIGLAGSGDQIAGVDSGPQVIGRAGHAIGFERLVSHQIISGDPGVAECNYKLCRNGGPDDFGNAFIGEQYGNRQGAGLGGVRTHNALYLDDTKLVGAALAADQAAVDGGTTASDGTDDPVPTDGADTAGDTDAPSTDTAGDEFTGSPEPSGQDLSSDEEKDLITSGWK